MIDNNLIQAGIVSKLKADSGLTTFLTNSGASGEIREAEFQGRDFVYPNVRVEIGTQVEPGNPPCYSEVTFTIYSHSEENSSKQANQLAGLADAALLRKNLSGTGFTTGIVAGDSLIAARRATERIWQAVGLYRMQVYETGGIV